MFARAYDLLMADVDYEAIYTWLKPYLKEQSTILDAGCGSGYLLLELIKNKHEAIGIDIDSSMLSLAYDKLLEASLSTSLYEHDLKEPLGVTVDVILSMFDVVNYFKGLKKVFKNMYDGLNAGGVFIFDAYKKEVLNDYADYVEIEDDPIHYAWSIKTRNAQLIHTIKINDETVQIKQYVHELSYLLNLLEDVGFKVEVHEGIDSRKHYIVAYK
jgi:SAM-dependent methyltransferase